MGFICFGVFCTTGGTIGRCMCPLSLFLVFLGIVFINKAEKTAWAAIKITVIFAVNQVFAKGGFSA